MSKTGGGGLVGGGSGSKARVSSSIPNNVRATILNIKEIARNHSDDDIYAMLKECCMDPNETTQRLLFLDTFHEVKSKRDKRKENMKSRPVGESRGTPANQWRGSRGARGTSYPPYSSYDLGEQRNAAIRRENVTGETRDKGFRPSSVAMNGPIKVPNGGHEAQSSGVGDTNLLKGKMDADSSKSPVPPKSSDGRSSVAGSQLPASVRAVKGEAQIQQITSESNEPNPIDRGKGIVGHSHLNKQELHIVNELQTSLPMTENVACGHSNVVQPKILGQCPPAEKVHPPGSVSVARSSSPQGVDEATSKIEKLKFSDGQHVLIPSHIQVPDSVKNMLSFGSFGIGEEHSNSENNGVSISAAAEVHDETTSKSSSCEEDAVPAVTDGKHVDHPEAPVDELEGNAPSEPEVSSATASKGDEMKEDHLPAVGPPFPVVQAAPTYSFGFMPPLLVDPLVKPDLFESQAHGSNSQAGVSPPTTTSPSTLPPVQSAAAGQNPVAPSPSSIALFRQSYPPNYVPYSHYYSPFYPPPAMHPYFGHTAFPILPPGSMYLPPPGIAAGMKVSPTPYKPGANAGNQGHVGLPSGYGSYNSAHVSFGPSASVTAGNSIGSEDSVPSLLKENSTYVGQQSEGSTMWLPSAGHDATTFPLNAFVNLPSPAQHLINSQSGPSAFVYHAVQPPMATPAPALTLLQQSQPLTGSVESVGPRPPNVYQQQVNSNI